MTMNLMNSGIGVPHFVMLMADINLLLSCRFPTMPEAVTTGLRISIYLYLHLDIKA